MNSHEKLNDFEFIEQIKSAKLPKELFNHSAHVRLAILLSFEHGAIEGITITQQIIYAYVNAIGVGDKYNSTITLASCKIITNRLKGYSNYQEVLLNNSELTKDFMALLLRHYSKELLFSQEAKLRFIEPDLLPF